MIIIVTIDAIIINSSLNITRFVNFLFNGEWKVIRQNFSEDFKFVLR